MFCSSVSALSAGESKTTFIARDKRLDVREPERLEQLAQAIRLDVMAADVDRAQKSYKPCRLYRWRAHT